LIHQVPVQSTGVEESKTHGTVLKLSPQNNFVSNMNTNSYLWLATSQGKRLNTQKDSITKPYGVRCSQRSLKAKLQTIFVGFCASMIGLFCTITPSRAQSITPQTYINDLYNWSLKTSPASGSGYYTSVCASFLGASAAADITVSVAIFEGEITAFQQGLLGPSGHGNGTFYAHDSTDHSVFASVTVPFWLYSMPSPAGLRLVLSIDFRGSKLPYGLTAFYFDKITSNGKWPSGNWIGLNGGKGSASGQVTLGCMKHVVDIVH
jgi:hypothetical protein